MEGGEGWGGAVLVFVVLVIPPLISEWAAKRRAKRKERSVR